MAIIRPARPEDFDAIGRIFHDAVHKLANANYSSEQCFAWSSDIRPAEYWRTRTSGLRVAVAQLIDTTVGFIGFSSSGHIDLLFTHPDFARRGIARSLLEEAENQLRALDVATAWTEASLTARNFFQSMGYQIVREQTVCVHGIDLRNTHMAKTLPPVGIVEHPARDQRDRSSISKAG
jgi:putative acetyltransferase